VTALAGDFSLLAKGMQATVTLVNGEGFMNGGTPSTGFGFSINPAALNSMAPASVKAGRVHSLLP
jgi:hypothetical protein